MMTQLASLPPRVVDAIGLGLLIVIVGGAYVLGVRPALDRRDAAATESQLLATELANAATAVEQLHQAETRRNQILATQGKALVLERADQINTRITRLTTLAAGGGITIQQLAPGAPRAEAGKPFTGVPIRVQGGGAFTDCVEFLRRLREEHRDIGIPSVTLAISQPAAENHAARLDMTLDLVWYAAPDDSAARK